MTWLYAIDEFKNYLRLERSLSDNSIEAYLDDVNKLMHFCEAQTSPVGPLDVSYDNLKNFIIWVNELSMSARTQARVLSGIRTFYKYLLMEDSISVDPTILIESPKVGRKLPEVLSIEEINKLLDAIDLSKPEGQRNKAMLETLYSCGLRVSELVNLHLSDLHIEMEFIKVIGKGNKERLVPISNKAIKEISNYLPDRNKLLDIITKENEDIVFLNRRGKKLTRVMIFTIIKDLAEKIGLVKNISPHTFRHSFATHLIDGGADLRAIQEMLGHESILTTEIYTHLDHEFLKSTILKFHPRS